MYRIVPDTNLIVAHLLNKRSSSARIIKLWKKGKCELGISSALLHEIKSIIGKPFMQKCKVSEQKITELFAELENNTVYVDKIPNVWVIKDDPADDKLLSTAIATKSDFIVTNDGHLLKLVNYKGVGIIRPSRFIKMCMEMNSKSN
jgi:putative PIN family toxin of toxin-antitoxin system